MALFKSKQKSASNQAVTTKQEPTPLYANGGAGDVKTFSVEPRKAAMIMAIVADKAGIPLNQLRFISIKEITE